MTDHRTACLREWLARRATGEQFDPTLPHKISNRADDSRVAEVPAHAQASVVMPVGLDRLSVMIHTQHNLVAGLLQT
jgi:hypothetical protein